MAVVSQTPQPFQPGFRIIDGSSLNAILASPNFSTADGITASTTQTRVGGTVIPVASTLIRVSAANASDAVTLGGAGAVIPAGDFFIIANKSGQTIQVFPPGANDKIDGGAAGAAVNLGNAKIGFYFISANIGGVLTINSGAMAVSS